MSKGLWHNNALQRMAYGKNRDTYFFEIKIDKKNISFEKYEFQMNSGNGSLFLFTPYKTFYLQSFQTPFRNALKTHGECL